MSDFDVAIPNAKPAEGGGDDNRKHDRPHWRRVAKTLLDNQLEYCELKLFGMYSFFRLIL